MRGEPTGQSGSKRDVKLDRISNLPSDVTEKILSRLPIRDAVRTNVLSRQWRYKSAILPHLVFDDRCVSTRMNHTIFVKIVDRVLLLHIGPIHKFKLTLENFVATSDIDIWILHLSRNSIKTLILQIGRGGRYTIPSCLFSCQELFRLELSHCLLKPPPSTFKGFKSLKALQIDNATMSQDVLENMIVSCPLLVTLTLIDCDGFTHLKINATCLRTLAVIGVAIWSSFSFTCLIFEILEFPITF